MSSENKQSNRSRKWRWIVYLLVGLSIASGYAFWKFQSTKNQLFGFQPPEMALAQSTSKEVIGDLGGMKVRIPRHYAEYVEYDDDPGFGEKRKEYTPERNFKSILRSFGMNARFPDMKGLETMDLKEAHKNSWLKPENPWIDISINAGSIYPSMGTHANGGLANKLRGKSEYWFSNYERAPQMDISGLEAYVVSGTDPRTGKPARESDSTDDIYIHETTNHVDTFISCGRTSVPGGVATCHMHFGLEPKAKVRIDAGFSPRLLPKWHSVRNSVSELIYSFEVRSEAEK